jgi:hypothetical protein
VHRFASIHRLNDYQHLLRRSERILIDSAIADPEIFNFTWPRPAAVRDLVNARLLPVRQSIGQLLSGYEPALLVSQLRSVQLTHDVKLSAEARVLQAWTRERLAACGGSEDTQYVSRPSAPGEEGALQLDFEYTNGHHFRWHGDLSRNHACIDADFGSGRSTMNIAVSLLKREAALSDAMFF